MLFDEAPDIAADQRAAPTRWSTSGPTASAACAPSRSELSPPGLPRPPRVGSRRGTARGDPRQQRARPGRGEKIAAAAAEHGAAIVQRHGGDRLRPPPPDRPCRQPAAAGRAGLRPRAGDRLGRLARRRARGRQPPLPRRLHRPAPRPSRSSATRARHRGAGLRPAWRERGARGLGGERRPRLRDGGVYWQTIGPRFETPAEIRLIAAHADVVGMTIASECIVAGELGLAYAAICVVDNLANGLGPEPLSVDRAGSRRARPTPLRLRDGLAAVLPP